VGSRCSALRALPCGRPLQSLTQRVSLICFFSRQELPEITIDEKFSGCLVVDIFILIYM